MGIENKIRQLQDSVRDAGWRIKSIPWQQDSRPEYVYNTPFTLLTGFGGALVFLGSIALVIYGIMPTQFLLVGLGGLIIAVFGRFYAAWHKHQKWLPVKAKCLDLEMREGKIPKKGTVWGYRVLCEFSYHGKLYTATPSFSHTVNFNNQVALEKYLNKTIDPKNMCTLWINPDNPLQCTFNKRPKI